MRRLVLATLVVLATTGFSWLERWAAPDSRLIDEHWQKRDATASTVVDHAAWATWLSRYVTTDSAGVNRVRYGTVTDADRAALNAYIDKLAAVRVTGLRAEEQLAYWLNLYNAVTVRAVLGAYPVASVRDIDDVWTRSSVSVEGRSLSLDDIEHGIVRPVFKEPRVHYAFNCAAVGCPNLQEQPFTSASLDRQFDAAARSYVNDVRGVSVKTGGGVSVSSIYNWFQEDFGGTEVAVLAHLRRFADADLATRLEAVDSIDDYHYDWALNGTQ